MESRIKYEEIDVGKNRHLVHATWKDAVPHPNEEGKDYEILINNKGNALFIDKTGRLNRAPLTLVSEFFRAKGNYTCAACGMSQGQHLEVYNKRLHHHHIFLKSEYPAYKRHVEDGFLACEDCHDLIHGFTPLTRKQPRDIELISEARRVIQRPYKRGPEHRNYLLDKLKRMLSYIEKRDSLIKEMPGIEGERFFLAEALAKHKGEVHKICEKIEDQFFPKPTGLSNILNISSGSLDPRARIISDRSRTVFSLGGEKFASMEGFKQAIKFPEGHPLRKVASGLAGKAAAQTGKYAKKTRYHHWEGRQIVFRSPEYYALIEKAYRARFNQSRRAMSALRDTKGMKLIRDLGYPEPPCVDVPAEKYIAILNTIRQENLK